MADELEILQDEIANDPETIGYAGKGDDQVADLLNATNTSRTLARPSLTAVEIFNSVVVAEFDALSEADQRKMDRIFSLVGDIDITPGSQADTIIQNVFNPGTTRTNLAGIAKETVSRATELGLRKIKVGHVTEARL
jgi:hypothetical protein